MEEGFKERGAHQKFWLREEGLIRKGLNRGFREWQFLILGTRAEDLWQGYETFSIILWG